MKCKIWITKIKFCTVFDARIFNGMFLGLSPQIPNIIAPILFQFSRIIFV